MTISIDHNGTFLYETAIIDATSLIPIIKQAYTKTPDINLVINANSNAYMGKVIEAYDAGRSAGLGNEQIFSTITGKK
jgi:biopolymer transport protein ExbD